MRFDSEATTESDRRNPSGICKTWLRHRDQVTSEYFHLSPLRRWKVASSTGGRSSLHAAGVCDIPSLHTVRRRADIVMRYKRAARRYPTLTIPDTVDLITESCYDRGKIGTTRRRGKRISIVRSCLRVCFPGGFDFSAVAVRCRMCIDNVDDGKTRFKARWFIRPRTIEFNAAKPGRARDWRDLIPNRENRLILN